MIRQISKQNFNRRLTSAQRQFSEYITDLQMPVFKESSQQAERESLETDFLIVGGGPAGLSAAIKLKQLLNEKELDYSVMVLEKGSQVGAHILSGNCFESQALTELIPDWKELGAPLNTKVSSEEMRVLLNNGRSIQVPHMFLPEMAKNTHKENQLISLSNLCKWLEEQAMNLDIEILSGFAGQSALISDDGSIVGVSTKDMGLDKMGCRKDEFDPGMNILAKQTILAEGCRGSISEKVIKHFELRSQQEEQKTMQTQSQAIGLKEIWEVPEANVSLGKIIHTIGQPTDLNTYSGGFIQHTELNKIHLGLVIALDQKDSSFNTYEAFQKQKTHPSVHKQLEGGKCISQGARALNEGGWQGLPKCSFPGGMLVGCSAGFVNNVKIKGTHNAIRSGILAAQSICAQLETTPDLAKKEIVSQWKDLLKSPIAKELKQIRNFRNGWKQGVIGGLLHGTLVTKLTKGREPYTLSKDHDRDCDSYTKNSLAFRQDPFVDRSSFKADGQLTFPLLDNLSRSNTDHEHDQPAHLVVKPTKDPLGLQQQFGGPEQRFCPANVYEWIKDEQGQISLNINAQNCLHCKTCSINTPEEYIDWNVPEGGGGPSQVDM